MGRGGHGDLIRVHAVVVHRLVKVVLLVVLGILHSGRHRRRVVLELERIQRDRRGIWEGHRRVNVCSEKSLVLVGKHGRVQKIHRTFLGQRHRGVDNLRRAIRKEHGRMPEGACRPPQVVEGGRVGIVGEIHGGGTRTTGRGCTSRVRLRVRGIAGYGRGGGLRRRISGHSSSLVDPEVGNFVSMIVAREGGRIRWRQIILR